MTFANGSTGKTEPKKTSREASVNKGESQPVGAPSVLVLELVQWQDRPTCLYLDNYRVVGGKPWGGGHAVYSWKVRVAQLQQLLSDARERGDDSVSVEVFKHTSGHYAVYLDDVLLEGPRANSRGARPRRVGSTVVLQANEVSLSNFARAHDVLGVPA